MKMNNDPRGGIAGINLEGKTVLIRKSFFKSEYNGDRRFKCESGFGCDPDSSGTKVFGTFLEDGEKTWVRRGDVESVESADAALTNRDREVQS